MEINSDLIKLFEKSRKSAKVFAEALLVEPKQKKPFKANYPQTFILESQKRDTWICVSRRTGKCLAEGTLVIDPVTLKPTPIEDLLGREHTYTFDFKLNKLVKTEAEWISSGKKECYRLTFSSGTTLTLSTDHPLFESKNGWVRTDTLRIGSKVLAPSIIDIFGDSNPSLDELESIVDITLLLQTVPTEVYSYSKDNLLKYIQSFFYLKAQILHSQKCITFFFWNDQLSLDFHHLLLRFGVLSRIDDGNLFVEEELDRTLFLNLMGVDITITEVKSPRRWETVIGIMKVGMRNVYDLSVEHEDHNFLANNIVVHNSYSLSLIAIWHALIKEGQRVVIFAPTSTQVDELFETIDSWIDANDILQALVDPKKPNRKQPQQRTFINGSTIKGHLMGMTGGLEGGKRGLTPNIIIVDEAQEFSDEDWKVIGPMMTGDEYNAPDIRCYVAGTINKPNNRFYDKFYKEAPIEDENVIFMPITENKDYSPERVATIKAKTPWYQWQTEYLLEVGESDSSVFKKHVIENCCAYDWEYGVQNIVENKVRFIGVDWDKVQAGTNIAVFQYSPDSRVLEVIYREEVERSRYTYLNACKLVQELYDAYQPELVIADQGQGEVQWEYMQSYAESTGSELANRLIKLAFNENIDIPQLDPEDTKPKKVKPFLVGQLQQKMDNGLFRFPAHDTGLKDQLIGYSVKARTENTIKFSTHNEHVIDCCLFALYGIWWLYENEFAERNGANHNTFRTFNNNDLPRGENEDLFGVLEGRNQASSNFYLPRSDIFNYNTKQAGGDWNVY